MLIYVIAMVSILAKVMLLNILPSTITMLRATETANMFIDWNQLD